MDFSNIYHSRGRVRHTEHGLVEPFASGNVSRLRLDDRQVVAFYEFDLDEADSESIDVDEFLSLLQKWRQAVIDAGGVSGLDAERMDDELVAPSLPAKSTHSVRYPCPCCGHLVFQAGPGSYDICPICGWEDDLVQLRWPDFPGGANRVSLIEAPDSYRRTASSGGRPLRSVTLPEGASELRDAGWRRGDLSVDGFAEPHRSVAPHPSWSRPWVRKVKLRTFSRHTEA